MPTIVYRAFHGAAPSWLQPSLGSDTEHLERMMHDRFERVRKLGQGTFGEVFLAKERPTGNLFAIKVLIQPTLEAREQFEREARHLARNIRNRHVVDLVEAHLDSTPPYLVLEYCEGGSLVDLPKPVSWHIAAHMLLHASAGLFDIHRATGFHRDIKPGNLLLARDPELGWVVKVGDWGLARAPFTVGPGMTRGPGGTPGYIAPEVLMGDLFDAKADIYSLGVVALELLTGSRSPAAMAQVDLPSRLRSLVERMSSRDPAIRPNITEVLGELAEVIKAASSATSEVADEGSDITDESSAALGAAPAHHRAAPPPVQPAAQPQAAPPRPAAVPPPHVAPAAAAAPPIPAPAAPSPAAPQRAAAAPAQGQPKPSVAKPLLTLGGAALLLAGVAALLRGDDKEWDENVGRYRGKKDGRFRPG